MTFGAVILFDVVATLGGGAFATLVLGAATLGAGRGCVVVGCVLVRNALLLSLAPAKIVDKSWMALMCLIFAAVVVGIAAPSALMRSAAVAMEISCWEVTGTWLWAGYRRHVSEKRDRRVAGM
jgi:hypothetical protein